MIVDPSAFIRQLVMEGMSSDIRNLLLTNDQLEVVKLAREKEISSALLCSLSGITSQNASGKLNKLYRSGYLTRRTLSAESGGLEHFYKSVF